MRRETSGASQNLYMHVARSVVAVALWVAAGVYLPHQNRLHNIEFKPIYPTHWSTQGSDDVKVPGPMELRFEPAIRDGQMRGAVLCIQPWINPQNEEGQVTRFYYVEIQLSALTFPLSFGLTNQTLANLPGIWGMRGLFYGRNLHDGARILQPNYGPEIQGGARVGMMIRTNAERMKVWFSHNRRWLGPAFDVPADTLLNAEPAVLFSGYANIQVGLPPRAAVSFFQQPIGKQEPYEGIWKLEHSQLTLKQLEALQDCAPSHDESPESKILQALDTNADDSDAALDEHHHGSPVEMDLAILNLKLRPEVPSARSGEMWFEAMLITHNTVRFFWMLNEDSKLTRAVPFISSNVDGPKSSMRLQRLALDALRGADELMVKCKGQRLVLRNSREGVVSVWSQMRWVPPPVKQDVLAPLLQAKPTLPTEVIPGLCFSATDTSWTLGK